MLVLKCSNPTAKTLAKSLKQLISEADGGNAEIIASELCVDFEFTFNQNGKRKSVPLRDRFGRRYLKEPVDQHNLKSYCYAMAYQVIYFSAATPIAMVKRGFDTVVPDKLRAVCFTL